jgi:WD40 repeat protein
MSENALLTTSLLYGIVARSIPLTGKILKGFIDASGTQHGLGVGNPNVEFTPNVSACALIPEGGAAKILWGYRNGEVAVSTAEGVMVGTRPAARFTRCTLVDQHKAEVKDVVWAEGGAFAASGDLEGVVKLWEPKTMKCLWSSTKKLGVLIPMACGKVAIDAASGTIAAGMMDGEIAVWTGLGINFTESASSVNISETRIAPPKGMIADPFQPEENHECTFLSLDPRPLSNIWVLAAYHGDPRAYRFEIGITRKITTRTSFGDESAVAVSSVLPSFASRPGERSFVVIGDQLGHVHVYDWESPLAHNGPVPALRRFEAHEDGAVTALAATSGVLVTGSAGGTTRVWDMLTLRRLRTVGPPSLPRLAATESVTQIAVLRDMMVVAVGKQVVAWKAGPVSHHVGKIATRIGKKVKREAKGHRMSSPC